MTDTNREFMKNFVRLSKVFTYAGLTLLISIIIARIIIERIFEVDQVEVLRFSILFFILVSMIIGIVGAIWLKDIMPVVWGSMLSVGLYALFKSAVAHVSKMAIDANPPFDNVGSGIYEKVWWSDFEAAQFNFFVASFLMLAYFVWFYLEIEAERWVRRRR